MNTQNTTTFTFSAIRLLVDVANQNDVSTRELYDFVRSKEQDYSQIESTGAVISAEFILQNLVESVQRHDCTLDDILNDNDVFYFDGLYFNTDNWVITADTEEPTHRDDANYCEHRGEYVSEDIVRVYTRRDEYEHWAESTAERHAYEYRGEYYTSIAFGYYNLVLVDGELHDADSVYFWESDGEYHLEPEEEEEERTRRNTTYLRDYHHDRRTYEINFTSLPTQFIGFEIEKEDDDVKHSLDIYEFEENCPKWKKERDGSLCGSTGFELISPKFELVPNLIRKHIEKNSTLLAHVNAEKSLSCGGHINVSEKDKTGMELFDEVKGYTPLFYALYYKRVDKRYCKGKKNSDLRYENDKYQAIKIHDNRIEYRIVSAVPNIDTLIWRTELIKYILDHKTDCPKQAFFNANKGRLKRLLVDMYADKYNVLIQRLIKYTSEFESINLSGDAEQTTLPI